MVATVIESADHEAHTRASGLSFYVCSSVLPW